MPRQCTNGLGVTETRSERRAGSEEQWGNPPYKFNRVTQIATDTLMLRGTGAPANGCGTSSATSVGQQLICAKTGRAR